MLTVNLFDAAFRHNPGSSVHGKVARHIRYVRDRMSWDGITLLTDDMLCRSDALDHLHSRVTVGWLLEPREYKPENYRIAERLLPRLDLLLTHDQELIDRYPDKVRLVPFGGCWIPQEQWGMPPKTAIVCQILSDKVFMPGHRLRHEIAYEFGFGTRPVPRVNPYGSGTHHGRMTYEERAAVLAHHEFAVVVENSRARNFFTEKLLDCFAVGTIPIYWGCPNIGDFFDARGILQFQTIHELTSILADLGYDRHLEGARVNLERMRQYEITDDYIALNILKEFA